MSGGGHKGSSRGHLAKAGLGRPPRAPPPRRRAGDHRGLIQVLVHHVQLRPLLLGEIIRARVTKQGFLPLMATPPLRAGRGRRSPALTRDNDENLREIAPNSRTMPRIRTIRHDRTGRSATGRCSTPSTDLLRRTRRSWSRWPRSGRACEDRKTNLHNACGFSRQCRIPGATRVGPLKGWLRRRGSWSKGARAHRLRPRTAFHCSPRHEAPSGHGLTGGNGGSPSARGAAQAVGAEIARRRRGARAHSRRRGDRRALPLARIAPTGW